MLISLIFCYCKYWFITACHNCFGQDWLARRWWLETGPAVCWLWNRSVVQKHSHPTGPFFFSFLFVHKDRKLLYWVELLFVSHSDKDFILRKDQQGWPLSAVHSSRTFPASSAVYMRTTLPNPSRLCLRTCYPLICLIVFWTREFHLPSQLPVAKICRNSWPFM